MKRFLGRFIFLSLVTYAPLLDASHFITPWIKVSFQKTIPQYYSKPAQSVQDLCTESDYVPIGCTHYSISYRYDYKSTFNKSGVGQVSEFDMKFYYEKGDLYVYIDDRYPKNSCEYNAIKKHEDLHVKIDQTVEIGKVKDSLKKCILEINKGNVSRAELNSAVKSCAQQAFDLDEEIRKKRNKELDLDKTKQPNLKQNCPSSRGKR